MSCDDCKGDQVFCKDCRHWTPTYSSIGECQGQGTSVAKFWIEGDKGGRLLTQATFGCRHFEAQPSIDHEVL